MDLPVTRTMTSQQFLGGTDMLKAILPAALAASCLSWPAIANESGAGWKAAITDSGWTRLTEGDELVMFARPPQRLPNGNGMMWFRVEIPGQSSATLTEYDCAGRRERILQHTAYRQGNLMGLPIPKDGPFDWQYPQPNTIGEMQHDAACRLLK